MKNVMKIVNSLEDLRLLIEDVNQTIENKTKNKVVDFWYVIRSIRSKLIGKCYQERV